MSRTGPRIIFFSTYIAILTAGVAFNNLVDWSAFRLDGLVDTSKARPVAPTIQSPTPFTPSPGGDPRGKCLPAEIFSSSEVVAVGAYEGAGETDFGFVGEEDAVGLIRLVANNAGPPITLLLNGYEPIIWDVSGIPAKRLRGIIVYGHGDQGVAHLPSAIPIRFAVKGLGEAACGEPETVYRSGRDLDAWQRLSQTRLGVGFNRFEGAYDPSVIHLEGGSAAKLSPPALKLSMIQASAPLERRALLPGERGLRQLMDQGAIRPATSADWVRFKRQSNGDVAYVVLRPTTLPGDMHGANSATFLVPKDVPMPSDAGSHNRIIRQDGSCAGSACQFDSQ